MVFGTVINCMDGRVQFPVLEYLKHKYEVDLVDSITEAGPLKILSERSEQCRINLGAALSFCCSSSPVKPNGRYCDF